VRACWCPAQYPAPLGSVPPRACGCSCQRCSTGCPKHPSDRERLRLFKRDRRFGSHLRLPSVPKLALCKQLPLPKHQALPTQQQRQLCSCATRDQGTLALKTPCLHSRKKTDRVGVKKVGPPFRAALHRSAVLQRLFYDQLLSKRLAVVLQGNVVHASSPTGCADSVLV